MRLIGFQPNQAFHGHLVKRVVVCPCGRFVMTNFRAAIFAPPGMVVIAPITHLRSVSLTQATRWATHHHFRARTRKIRGDVNPQCVLLVIGTRYSYFDLGVACWVDPSHTVSEVLLEQWFLISKACLLRCWPRHCENTSLHRLTEDGRFHNWV